MMLSLRVAHVAYLCVVLFASQVLHAQELGVSMTVESLPALPKGIVGHALAVLDGRPMVAGGTGAWPTTTNADAEASVYLLSASGDTWTAAGSLEQPVAFAATASDAGAVYLAGGLGSSGAVASVVKLQLGPDGLTQQPLPDLPEVRAYGGAAVVKGVLYVFGGLGPALDAPQTSGWKFDLAAGDSWVAMEPLPEAVAVPPVVGTDGNAIVAISGPGPDGQQGAPGAPAYRYMPGAGWTSIAPAPLAVRGVNVAPLGQNHMLVMGDAPDNSSQSAFYAFHNITNTWTPYASQERIARGAKLLPWRDGVLTLGGIEDTTAQYLKKIEAVPQRFGVVDYATLIAYFGILVGVGLYFSRKEHSTDAFFLGNRKLPWWAVGISIFGTSLSSITYLTIPANAFAGDWVLILSNVGIVLVAPVVVAWYVPRFRSSSYTTAYEYLEDRFNYPVRLYGSLTFILFQVARIGIVLYLPAIALSTATGISITMCVLAMGIIATIYTVLGGIEAVVWTDVLQAVVLIAGALLTLVIIIFKVDGGAGTILSEGAASGKFHTFTWSWDTTTTTVWVCLVGNFFLQLYPRTADQAMVQRYLTTPTVRDGQRAVWVDAVLTLPVSFIFFGMGTALWVFYRHHPDMLHPELRNDAIVPLFVVQNFPAGLAGILIAGVFAASMSTLDSSLNSMASVIVTDFYKRWAKGANERTALNLARWVTIGLGVFGTGAALVVVQLNVSSMFDAWLRVVGLLGGGLSGVFALGIFTRKANGPGVLAGVVASGVTVYAVMTYTATHYFLYPAVAFIMAAGVGYAVSLAIPDRTAKG